MNKMEQLFQEQRRNLLSMMMYAKQGLPPTINKDSMIDSMKQPLKEQNNSSKQPKRNHDISSTRNKNNSEKKMKQKHVEDVHF